MAEIEKLKKAQALCTNNNTLIGLKGDYDKVMEMSSSVLVDKTSELNMSQFLNRKKSLVTKISFHENLANLKRSIRHTSTVMRESLQSTEKLEKSNLSSSMKDNLNEQFLPANVIMNETKNLQNMESQLKIIDENEELETELRLKMQSATKLTAIVLGVVLSVHSIFEGMSIGLQTKISDLWTLTIAVLAHRWITAIALAICFVRNKYTGKIAY